MVFHLGSTEKVFEMKPDLFDCLVIDGVLKIEDEAVLKACSMTKSDSAKLKEIIDNLKSQ